MNCVWKNREELHEFLMKVEQRIERDEEIPEERRKIIEAIQSNMGPGDILKRMIAYANSFCGDDNVLIFPGITDDGFDYLHTGVEHRVRFINGCIVDMTSQLKPEENG